MNSNQNLSHGTPMEEIQMADNGIIVLNLVRPEFPLQDVINANSSVTITNLQLVNSIKDSIRVRNLKVVNLPSNGCIGTYTGDSFSSAFVTSCKSCKHSRVFDIEYQNSMWDKCLSLLGRKNEALKCDSNIHRNSLQDVYT